MIDLHIWQKLLPLAWEQSIISLIKYGDEYPGRYWRHGMPVGRAAHMTIVATHWGLEPCVHRGFTCTPEDFLAYATEITDGTERGWDYTYHDRIFKYGAERIDQYEYALNCLTRKPESNKAVITLADPIWDSRGSGAGSHIPCLREIKWRIDGHETLDTMLYWRSRDAINAALPNMFGLLQLTERFASDLEKRLYRPIRIGKLYDVTDCYHINGAHMPLAQKILDMMSRPDEERTWTTAQLRDVTHG
jgi:thymidylate synthase